MGTASWLTLGNAGSCVQGGYSVQMDLGLGFVSSGPFRRLAIGSECPRQKLSLYWINAFTPNINQETWHCNKTADFQCNIFKDTFLILSYASNLDESHGSFFKNCTKQNSGIESSQLSKLIFILTTHCKFYI